MTFDQTKEILTMLQVEYPQSFSKLDYRQMQAKLQLWAEEFAQDDYRLVSAAVRVLIRSNREFAPNIGQIREKMHQLSNPGALTETEAWALVSKACRNGTYGHKEEFAKLPPDVQAAVGSSEMLKQWATMDADEVESVVASNFMRSYKINVKRKQEMALVPPEVRELLTGVTGKMMIGGVTNEPFAGNKDA